MADAGVLEMNGFVAGYSWNSLDFRVEGGLGEETFGSNRLKVPLMFPIISPAPVAAPLPTPRRSSP